MYAMRNVLINENKEMKIRSIKWHMRLSHKNCGMNTVTEFIAYPIAIRLLLSSPADKYLPTLSQFHSFIHSEIYMAYL